VQGALFKNYITIAFRNLWKNRTFSFINIFGLVTGIACSLLIFLFVTDELSYDRFHKDAGNIYRIVKDFINDDGSRIPDATTPAPLAPAMQKEIPEVVSITRIRPNWGRSYLIKYGDKKITEEKVYGVDSSLFDVFTFPFVQGDANNAFKDINSIVLTQSAAKRYFGNENPVGKTLEVDSYGPMMISGVIKDVPSNAHFHFDFLVSFHKQPGDPRIETNWNRYNDYTYVKVKPGTNISNLVKKIQALNDRNVEKSFSVFYMQPIKDIHLTSNLKWELEPNGDKQHVYIFTLVGLFIILIAGINYMNLTTAKASVRAKEIGVRKVVGAERRSLINQFLVESVITCLIASILALGLAKLLLPIVNDLTSKQLALFADPKIVLYLFLGTFLLGILAGFFPALYLSSFKPIAVLKGFKLNESGALSLRKALVIVQFTISIVLIIGAIVISQQMRYLMSAKLGFDADQVMVINGVNFLSPSDINAFRQEVAQIPNIKKVASAGGMLPGRFSTTRVRVKGSENEQQVNYITVGYEYLDVMNIQIKEGRGFSPKFQSDTMNNGIPGGPLEQTVGSVVLNETAIKDLGIAEPVVGKQIVWGRDGDTTYYLNIIGVAKDFHFTSLRNQIKPFAFMTHPRAQGNFVVKLSGHNLPGTLAQIENKWKGFNSERPFSYSFLDEAFAQLYQSERRFQKLFIILVILGIVIACLGLLGLATFAAQQRVKEIGIRKVLGASVVNVVQLLSKDFIKLVIIAFAVATPIAWYAVHQWLQDFAYRIDILWWVFPLAGLIAVLIALFTISFQSIKAAMANPVKNLRTE
ncbi:MAG: ABC transporter permease, partial [Flavisolibacter sp.]|nr:ABC transporter permease [Flavisolibacter sp.]